MGKMVNKKGLNIFSKPHNLILIQIQILDHNSLIQILSNQIIILTSKIITNPNKSHIYPNLPKSKSYFQNNNLS